MGHTHHADIMLAKREENQFPDCPGGNTKPDLAGSLKSMICAKGERDGKGRPLKPADTRSATRITRAPHLAVGCSIGLREVQKVVAPNIDLHHAQEGVTPRTETERRAGTETTAYRGAVPAALHLPAGAHAHERTQCSSHKHIASYAHARADANTGRHKRTPPTQSKHTHTALHTQYAHTQEHAYTPVRQTAQHRAVQEAMRKHGLVQVAPPRAAPR